MLLYTEQDHAAAKKKMSIQMAIFVGMLLVTIGLMILFVTACRNRIAVAVVSMLGACLCYTDLVLKLMPWVRYCEYLRDIRMGRTHTTEAWFVSCSDSTRKVDGVAFHEMIVRLGDGGEKDERMFFWDDDKELPAIEEGQKMTLVSFGNYITELKLEA